MFKPVNPTVSFPALEKELLEKWQKNKIFEKYLAKNKDSTNIFSFLDGPITANNPMGVHHAWGRTYKDLWRRFKNMQGYRQQFKNGFDCQGLWVEVEVEKELGIRNKQDIENLIPGDKKASIARFVEFCKQRVLKFSAIQTEQSKRLGYFMNWEHSYYTMSDENNYMIWRFLKAVFEKGWIYKGHESVPWCPRCQTAISQHEMLTEDYKEVVHDSIYIKFPVVGKENEYLLVWTTTPWTIPANIAIAVDRNLNYSLVKGMTGDYYWIAKDRIESVFKKGYKKIIKTVKGKELVGLRYSGPFDEIEGVQKVALGNRDKFHIVVATDDRIMPISMFEGTGLVHTAVSAGTEDFSLGKKLGLPMIAVIEDNADYVKGLGFLSGQNAKKHPEIILDYLKEKEEEGENWIFLIEKYKHRYPVCWRCKTELVWKVTDEWYFAMDKKDKSGKTYREQMIEVAKKISWLPTWGLDRELDWLKNMHDWLISKKNRYWGLALPIYECPKCGNFEVIGSREELKKRAVEGWEKFDGYTPHKPYIDEVKIKCGKCGDIVSRIDDVGNVWLDAGIVPFSTMPKEFFPADFITESFPGQFKNWFYSLIAMSTALEGTNPFKTVLGYALVRDEHGDEMHKSKGNSIEFNEAADKFGVDVMRWMYAKHDPEQNLNFGPKVADETRRQFHLMLWNIYNFFVLNANADEWNKKGFGPAARPDQQPEAKNKNVLDLWALARLNETTRMVVEDLNSYNAAHAALALENFVRDLSLWYVRRSRDRVGPTAKNQDDKNAFYTTMYNILTTLSRLLAPFVPFIADEIYTNLTGEESVHLSFFPKSDPDINEMINPQVDEEMNAVLQIVEMGHAARKKQNIKVRQPLKKITYSLQAKLPKDLEELVLAELNVKEAEFKKGELAVGLDTEITPELKAEGQAREIVRSIQLERKKLGTSLMEKVNVTLPDWPKEFEDVIKRNALVKNLYKGDVFAVERI